MYSFPLRPGRTHGPTLHLLPRPTLDDLDPESATTDALVAMARGHRQGEEYPTAEALLASLPVVLRALCDHLLSGEATALDVAYRIASLIDAVEGRERNPPPARQTH
ncbi:MAG: hypothetical protein RKR03_04165 [Candidatus Competibacter sp.]|nr:hypothetical protein [Candidatus Competibacter sp.]